MRVPTGAERHGASAWSVDGGCVEAHRSRRQVRRRSEGRGDVRRQRHDPPRPWGLRPITPSSSRSRTWQSSPAIHDGAVDVARGARVVPSRRRPAHARLRRVYAGRLVPGKGSDAAAVGLWRDCANRPGGGNLPLV